MEPNPAQRRDAPIYDNYPSTSTKAPWTTARCNRLLRPLTSRINILRKGKERCPPRSEQRNAGPKAGVKWGEKDDPSWIQSGRRMKHHKTYAHRRACSDMATSVRNKDVCEPLSIVTPGEVTVPTPVILRARDINAELSDPVPLAKWNKSHCSNASCYLSGLRKDTDPSTWQLYEKLSSGLDALLKATTTFDNKYMRDAESFPVRSGARSLLSMCLRRVPEYIKLEEAWNELEPQDETGVAPICYEADVASATFSELESLGTSAGGGWKGLLEVVRSHGIRIVCDALEEGVLCERMGEVLAWICIENTAFDEAEAIICAMISAVEKYPEPAKTDSPLFYRWVCVPLATLDTFAAISSRRGYQFRELEALFRAGRLRKEWLTCRDITKIWQEAIQALTERNSNYPYAMTFVATAIELTWGMSSDLLDDNTHLLRFEGRGSSSGNLRQAITGRRRLSIDFTKGQKTAPQELLINSLDNTVYSVVTTLASIAILNQRFFETEPESSTDGDEKISPALRLVHRLSTDILRASQFQHIWPRHAAGISRRVLPALLAGLFVLPSSAEDSRNQKVSIARTLTRLIELSDSREVPAKGSSRSNVSRAVLDSAYCINSITVCCAKATKDGGFPHISYLMETIRGLLELPAISHDLDHKDRSNLHRIAVDSSYEFAEQSRTDGLLEWARDVEQWSLGQDNIRATLTPREGCRPQHGYQWEGDLCRLTAESPELARKYHIPQHIEGRKKQPKFESAPNRSKGYQNWSDFEDSEEDTYRSHKRRRGNHLPKTPKISAMIIGEHPPTSSPLLPVDSPNQLSSPMDQLSGSRTVGFGNLALRFKVNEQRRDDKVKHGSINVCRVNDGDIDELGKPEPTWAYAKTAITRVDPPRQFPAKRTANRGHHYKIGHSRKTVKKYRWLQERVITEDFSEDELLG